MNFDAGINSRTNVRAKRGTLRVKGNYNVAAGILGMDNPELARQFSRVRLPGVKEVVHQPSSRLMRSSFLSRPFQEILVTTYTGEYIPLIQVYNEGKDAEDMAQKALYLADFLQNVRGENVGAANQRRIDNLLPADVDVVPENYLDFDDFVGQLETLADSIVRKEIDGMLAQYQKPMMTDVVEEERQRVDEALRSHVPIEPAPNATCCVLM
jgi:hypothetical protein